MDVEDPAEPSAADVSSFRFIWVPVGRGWAMMGPVPFVRRGPTLHLPPDPEQLYRVLAQTNHGPEALWGHQVDVLRDWHGRYADGRDVAIELPTGAGKTLVGGLVGEYRRRKDGDRVVYLCPTRQLARQTAAALTRYGIPAALLIGPVRDWNPSDRARYAAGDAVAVSVYSHVFNSNPALNDAQLLILDDAHAAEGAVASPWSLTVRRDDDAYGDVLALLAGAFDPLVVQRLQSDSPDRRFMSTVYLASPAGVADRASDLLSVLETARTAKALSADAGYALKLIEGQLDRCLVYASHRSILIRPLIAPTACHPAFDSPRRRLYMSATLGAGGELERAFGRTKVDRIPIPKGWDKQGTGRRFFCFPELTTDLARTPAEVPAWTAKTIAAVGRAVVLAPDRRTADMFTKEMLPESTTVVTAEQVEDDLAAFTAQPDAALVLTNRYDGIDLPDDQCRLVVIAGLPARGDLQERFLHTSLGALEVLEERIRARIVQGAGRATRNARDYAAVLIYDNELSTYLSRGDVLQAITPEVHAEVRFGLENSLKLSSTDMSENLGIFLQHADEWAGVEADIVADRDQLDQVSPPGTGQLQAAARHEVAAWQAVWQGEWPLALEQARRVIDALRGGQVSQRYAALWNYLAACWSVRAAGQSGDPTFTTASRGYYDDARAAARGTTWLAHLAAPADRTVGEPQPQVDPLDLAAAAAIAANLDKLGRPAKFDPAVAAVRAGLLGTDPTGYEAALVAMGPFLGTADSVGTGGAHAAPDAAWVFGDVIWVCWEAKSDAKTDSELGANDVREAGSHVRYTESQRSVAAPGDSPVLLVTPQQRIHPAAHAVAEDHVYLVRPAQVVDAFDRVIRAWRAVRSQKATDAEAVYQALADHSALPSQWLPRLRAEPLAQPSTT